MKFAVTRVFELTKVLSTKSGTELRDFFDYFSQMSDQLLRLAQNGITIKDNMKVEFKTISYREGQTSYEVFGLPSGKPTLVLFNTADSDVGNPFQFAWKYDGKQAKIQLYIKATTALKTPANVEIVLFYP